MASAPSTPVNDEPPAATGLVDQELLAHYYSEFRGIARRALRGQGARITLQPTELAHEAALRLLAGSGVSINDEAHFLALAVRVIRTTLIDEVRRRKAAKRSCDIVTLWDNRAEVAAPIDVEAIDEALNDLTRVAPEAAAVAELRFYVGLTMAEIARELSISESTALRRWRIARAWLFKEMAIAEKFDEA